MAKKTRTKHGALGNAFAIMAVVWMVIGAAIMSCHIALLAYGNPVLYLAHLGTLVGILSLLMEHERLREGRR